MSNEADKARDQGERPPDSKDLGEQGHPINRRAPFVVGLLGGLGALSAYAVWQIAAALSSAILLIIVAGFLALALEPLVAQLISRGLSRGWSVAAVALGFIGVIALVAAVIAPRVVQQALELGRDAPGALDRLMHIPSVQSWNERYGIVEQLQKAVVQRAQDPNTLSGVASGVIGAGWAVAVGAFQVITVIALTVYFLAALPQIRRGAYALVPSSRRQRVVVLSDEIASRVGGYALGQVLVATVNGLLSWAMMRIVGVPYAAVLAIIVGLLGLIPMIGATFGAGIVALVAGINNPPSALIVIAYYVVYQQIENYVIVPRVMRRTVHVPGFITIVAALVGGTLLGIPGALMAIPTAAGLLLIYREVLVPRMAQL